MREITLTVQGGIMRRLLVFVVVVGGLGAAAHGGAGERPLHALDDYVILGRDRVVIGGGTLVESGHVGAIGGTIELGRNAHVIANVAANKIEMKRDASAGSLSCQ